MDVHQERLKKQQLRWQSLRPFNITIVCSFIFFFLIGIALSYSSLDSSPTFTAPLIVPTTLLILSITMLYTIVKKHDVWAQRIIPVSAFILTVFISVDSHIQEQTYQNSFLYLVLLLPLFYSYLLAYNARYLMTQNIFLLVCYIFASVMGNTDPLVFLFNSAFLFTLCYLTMYTQCRADTSQSKQSLNDLERNTIISKKSGRYLNSIIHDIRQPLSSLSLYSHLLEKTLTDTQHLQLAQSIKHSSEELERWISSILDLARLDNDAITPSITEFELSSALSPIIQKYKQQALLKSLNLSVRIPKVTVKGDIRLLTSIVDVLLSNAMTHGSQDNNAKVLLSVRQYQKQAKLQVWNQGEEIESSIFDTLFDEVAQAENSLNNKTKGIGLGLAIAQRKAHLCDTNIEAKTTSKGSCFTLVLETGLNPQKRKDLKELSNQSLSTKILLIDDDQGILTALHMLLESWGYHVECAETAEEGLDKYSASDFDLVISDFRLPNQKTGLDVLKQIKVGTPSILLTGEADPEKLKEVKESSKVLDYMILNKPVKPASLRGMLKQLL